MRATFTKRCLFPRLEERKAGTRSHDDLPRFCDNDGLSIIRYEQRDTKELLCKELNIDVIKREAA